MTRFIRLVVLLACALPPCATAQQGAQSCGTLSLGRAVSMSLVDHN